MKKIRCLLVDDEPLALSLLQKHLGQLDFMEVIATCPNAIKALEVLKSQEIDLLFLDIRMPQVKRDRFSKNFAAPSYNNYHYSIPGICPGWLRPRYC
jgi:two-component system LytT family response regulator